MGETECGRPTCPLGERKTLEALQDPQQNETCETHAYAGQRRDGSHGRDLQVALGVCAPRPAPQHVMPCRPVQSRSSCAGGFFDSARPASQCQGVCHDTPSRRGSWSTNASKAKTQGHKRRHKPDHKRRCKWGHKAKMQGHKQGHTQGHKRGRKRCHKRGDIDTQVQKCCVK